MKMLNVHSVDRTKLSDAGKQALTKIDELQLKARITGGLDFRDQYELTTSHKNLQADIDRINEEPILSAEGSAIEEEWTEHPAPIMKAIEELKKLPVDVRDPKEVWTENSRYASWRAKNPAAKTIRVDISRAKRK
jgi:hypothetical protein